MKPKEMEKIIQEDGWYLTYQNGSHKKFKHPTKVGYVTIPFHNTDLRPGTLNSIYKQAGLKKNIRR